MVHSGPGHDTVMEEHAHIGHGAVLHYCRIGRDALVGMNAVVMDDADVGERSLVAAMSFVRIGARIPPGVLVAGSPARVVRELSDQDFAWKRLGTDLYVELAARCRVGLERVAPLAAVEPQRRRSEWPSLSRALDD